MTKYEIELSEEAVRGVRTLADALDKNLPTPLLDSEKAAIIELAEQLPAPALPDGVYVYRGNTYLSAHFVRDGKSSSSMDAGTGFMPFALDVLPDSVKNWTRISDLPKVYNGG